MTGKALVMEGNWTLKVQYEVSYPKACQTVQLQDKRLEREAPRASNSWRLLAELWFQGVVLAFLSCFPVVTKCCTQTGSRRDTHLLFLWTVGKRW